MSMFCFQCQETAKNEGCTVKGVCGKNNTTANLQDLLIYNVKGLCELMQIVRSKGFEIKCDCKRLSKLIVESIFSTITNVNFDDAYFIKKIKDIVIEKRNVKYFLKESNIDINGQLSDEAKWEETDETKFAAESLKARIVNIEDEDIRSLAELLKYGIKGISAYYDHAIVLGYYDHDIIHFIIEAFAYVVKDNIQKDKLLEYVTKCGDYAVKAMAILDKANTETYGTPEPTEVETGVRNRPGILISGHDLKDMEQLLKQSENSNVDIYTHGEMLPAHYYPDFKKYPHFAGNYGGSWWKQKDEFEKFNGPIVMTTNCLVPPKESYKERLFTTGVVGFEGVKQIKENEEGKKYFSDVIEMAKNCKPPIELENIKITGGFAHSYVTSIADKILDLVNRGKIKKFIVMAGCDGRHKSRDYYTEFAKKLPKDTVILTAGCAKYRYNKLNLGNIEGVPRVLDAGQCNDSYSLAVIALKLAEILKVDINQLPIEYNIAWYEQKAVAVLLALLSLGIKNIHIGPTIPAFLSSNILNVLIENYKIGTISDPQTDMEKMTA